VGELVVWRRTTHSRLKRKAGAADSMATDQLRPQSIDEYIAAFSPEVAAVARYAGEKGNLRFPLDQPIPYGLIERIVRLRVKQNLAQAAAKSKKRR
jgi:uncharacterized protein YdhG (YjbR/CyaY superfamily)